MSLENVEQPMTRLGKFEPELYMIIECYCGAVIDASIPLKARFVPLKTYEPEIKLLKSGRKLVVEPTDFQI